ncbi:MAG: type III pantothenate kinase [Rhodocyclaceae bacterium]|nr:type III pantothenate kinase [Rhodocyclaceae bacterium]
MLLCLDAGNSRLKWGLHDGADWQAMGALEHAEMNSLLTLLPCQPERILACNVAGERVAERIEALAQRMHAPLGWFFSRAHCVGVTNGYAEPEKLGADRFAALIAAHALADGDKLVVLAGTATTLDLLRGDGQHLGGVILPGGELMRQALAHGTAGLPLASGSYRALPTNTQDAITSGILEATVGAIERLAQRFASYPDILVMLSGGAAETLRPLLRLPCRLHASLVLEGLKVFALTSPSVE